MVVSMSRAVFPPMFRLVFTFNSFTVGELGRPIVIGRSWSGFEAGEPRDGLLFLQRKVNEKNGRFWSLYRHTCEPDESMLPDVRHC